MKILDSAILSFYIAVARVVDAGAYVLNRVTTFGFLVITLPSSLIGIPFAICLFSIQGVSKTDITTNTLKGIEAKLQSDSVSIEEKRILAEEVYNNAASYPPEILADAGIYYLSQKDLEKGAELCVGAVLRTEIDIRLIGDISLENLSYFIREMISDNIENLEWSDAEYETWLSYKKAALSNFEKWDRSTPRNYNIGELDQEKPLTDEEKSRIIARVYREISLADNFLASQADQAFEDDFLATKEDECFFDRKDRIFYAHQNEGHEVSFSIPKHIIPHLDRFGKYSGTFFMSNHRKLHFIIDCSTYPTPFEEFYQRALSDMEDSEEEFDHSVERYPIPQGLDAYRKRFSYRDEDETLRIYNKIYIVNGNIYYDIRLDCSEAQEAECLKEMELLIHSMNFSKE